MWLKVYVNGLVNGLMNCRVIGGNKMVTSVIFS